MHDELEWVCVFSADDGRSETFKAKVEGGHLYTEFNLENGIRNQSMCFVPDVDLTRYQAHLREAYTKGFADGLEEGKAHKELLSEPPTA